MPYIRCAELDQPWLKPIMSNESDKRYAFTPYFEFINFGNPAQKYIRYDQPDGSINVRMRLAIFDDTLKQASAAWMSEKTLQTVSPMSVQLLPITQMTITEENSNAIVNLPLNPTH